MRDNTLPMDLSEFLLESDEFHRVVVPEYRAYQQIKRDLVETKQAEMRLSEFKPRVLTTFVRNKLIDKVYLPLIGANLAKQIGAYGEGKRTDLMGLSTKPGCSSDTCMRIALEPTSIAASRGKRVALAFFWGTFLGGCFLAIAQLQKDLVVVAHSLLATGVAAVLQARHASGPGLHHGSGERL